jgi:dihydropteroate synthase
MCGTPLTMQTGEIAYNDLLSDVSSWLAERVEAVIESGVPRSQILVDPGIGFGKTDQHNLELTRGLDVLETRTGCAVLYGASRKSLIGRIAGVESPKERLGGSLALAGAAARRGARILRVHDVRQTVQYLKIDRHLSEN